VPCARCGAVRPPAARWDEGPLCDPCYTAALRHRGYCDRCGIQRRLVAPPGPGATTCADCAGLPVTHACTGCGVEDKLYEQGRCARCSLAGRARHLLSGGTGQVPAELTGVLEAIAAARTPRSALNWLRKGAAAGLLADIAAGRLPATHQVLDTHPSRQAAEYLRHILLAHGVLPARDEGLARAQRWLENLLASISTPEHRRLVQTYAAWQVMRRLRRRSEASPRPRTTTAHARNCIKAAARFLAWLDTQGQTLASCRQADAEQWLSTAPGACYARDFLLWAASHHHCPHLQIPPPPRTAGPATEPQQRWDQLARLLHDDSLDIIDRVAGCLLLLYGQQQSRIAAMTTDQVARRSDGVFVHLGKYEIPTPEPLASLLIQLIENGKSHTGVGSPAQTRWLFPGGLPGRPITAKHLAGRLRRLAIPTQPGRRSALIDLAAQLPAGVLADLLNLHPTTAAKWSHEAGADWSRYAAEIARTRNHQPCE
jgi:integrase